MLVDIDFRGIKEGQAWFSVPLTPQIESALQNSDRAVADIEDSRSISLQQRRKAYVLIRCISEWWGYTPQEATKELTKLMFASSGQVIDIFSLSDCDRTTARLYITWLIEFCLVHDIPCGEPLWKLCEDLPKYIWVAAVNKRCAVCGKKAVWHHAEDRVGMGRNRKEICHIGMRGMPLCAKHHSECHNMAQADFNKKYLLESIVVDEKIADVYKLRKRKG